MGSETTEAISLRRSLSSRVLITGASGFLGSRLRDRLLQLGAEVHATSRSSRVSDNPRLVWWRCDVAQLSAIRGLFDKLRPELIYHLSGRVTAKPEIDLVLPTFTSLLQSTVNVLTVATEFGCRRVVLAGSSTEPAGVDASPGSPYAAAKYCSNTYGRLFHKICGTPVVILRPFMTYGPGQAPTKLIPYVILSLLRQTAPELSSGMLKADWIYIDDVIDGFLAAGSEPEIDGSTIDLGTGALLSIRDIVGRIVAMLQPKVQPSFGVWPDRPFEEIRCADTRNAWERLRWQASTSIDQGLAQTISWFRDQSQIARSS
jgi:UDP-glucose 4-epimerase